MGRLTKLVQEYAAGDRSAEELAAELRHFPFKATAVSDAPWAVDDDNKDTDDTREELHQAFYANQLPTAELYSILAMAYPDIPELAAQDADEADETEDPAEEEVTDDGGVVELGGRSSGKASPRSS